MSEGVITAIISTLLSVVGYFAMRWLEGINKQLDELESLIDDLSKKVAELERNMVTRQELSNLRRQARNATPQVRNDVQSAYGYDPQYYHNRTSRRS